jgi:polyisoprenoid-binding protein YceI
MRFRPAPALCLALATLALGPTAAAAPETYEIDPVHSTIIFRTKHMNVSYVYGRFDDFSGKITVDDQNLANAKVEVTVKTQSVSTGNGARDDHLRSPDFFAAAQFPTITFASTGVKKTGDAYDVTGNLTLHGVTKPVTVKMQKVGQGPGWQGKGALIGFEGTLDIKRSEFGMTTHVDAVSDEVRLIMAFEAKR